MTLSCRGWTHLNTQITTLIAAHDDLDGSLESEAHPYFGLT